MGLFKKFGDTAQMYVIAREVLYGWEYKTPIGISPPAYSTWTRDIYKAQCAEHTLAFNLMDTYCSRYPADKFQLVEVTVELAQEGYKIVGIGNGNSKDKDKHE